MPVAGEYESRVYGSNSGISKVKLLFYKTRAIGMFLFSFMNHHLSVLDIHMEL